MYVGCLPVPNRRTGTSWSSIKGWRKARERELSINSPLPQLGEDQGGRKPQRETFHRATRFFREALSQTFPFLPPQAKRFQDTRRPSESEQPRANPLESVPFLSSKKNEINRKSNFDSMDLRPMRWWHMRAHELLKSGFQTWVALCNSIHYRAIGWFLE